LAAAERYATAAGTVGTAAAVAHCRGLVEGDARYVLEAADQLRGCGWLVSLADALEDAAVLLAAHGDLDRARAAQAEASALYEQFGAEWDLRRMDGRLRPYGIRRGQRGARNRPRSGWNALTPTEQRVAHLVAEGMSNPEIAEELVMSRRTVQTHVSSILTKLDAHSRAEIAHATVTQAEN
jgi:DNA-binding NarL/FixJ family response regulator